MASRKPLLTAPPPLPNELCRNIVESLHYLTDRSTLLHLAIASKLWCAESQRVLFRTVGDDATDLDDSESLIATHTLFLQAIILSPTRLGPYVRTYKQHKLLGRPCQSEIPLAAANPHLWDLTAEALPALVNLKHLFVVSLNEDPKNSRASFLEGCTFKLTTLRWGCEVLNPDTDPFVAFLHTQHNLSHLQVGVHPSRQNLSWLPDGVCPGLSSASCRLDSAAHVMATRKNIAGLEIWSDWTTSSKNDLSNLRHLKYLSLPAFNNLMIHWEAISPHTVLLELAFACHLHVVQTIAGFSKVRVLALLQAPREAPHPGSIHYAPIDVEAEHNLRIQLTMESFRRCPNLKYVVVEDIHRGEGPRRFKKVTMNPGSGGPDAVPDIHSTEFVMKHEPGTGWWTAYGLP